MQDFDLDFEWPVAKYEIGHPPAPGLSGGFLGASMPALAKPGPLSLIATSGPRRWRPTTAAYDKSIDALALPGPKSFEQIVVKAAGAVGMLYGTSQLGEAEALGDWRQLSDWLRVIFGAEQMFVHGLNEMEVGTMKLHLQPSKERKPRIVFKPLTMRDALIFHACRRAAGGTHVNMCLSCSAWFLSGGARGRGKKIASSKFCCDQCRWDYNNARRR